ncbi:MAG: hypothetical protein KF782_12145 [Labilithrix sp.]|nr:hypothetical protein [Labilithrix sp.]
MDKPLIIGDDLPAPPSFTSVPEGGADAEAGLIAYCPSSQCPPGWTTCPDSRFPCDTNVLADSRNCGACGMACPPRTGYEQFTCSEGTCKLECDVAFGSKDCDGLIDNGCESGLLDPTNCGACGVVCAQGERCTWQDADLKEVGCGCPPGKVACPSCKDLSDDDGNCGACNHRCDPTGGPDAPQYTNVYYGCGSGQCGAPKCAHPFIECDGDLGNGCETSSFTEDDCGDCGKKCGAGQRCAVDLQGQPMCMCDPGWTFCQTGEMHGLPQGYCANVGADSSNCGACGNRCEVFGGIGKQMPLCDFGKCAVRCLDGAADCNGSQSDGCEIDTKSDPRNCGGCGITCDLMMGQACVAGRCVVEPCDRVDAGEVTR